MTLRKPVAFRLDQEDVAVVKDGNVPPLSAKVVVEEEREADAALPVTIPRASRSGFRWSGMFFSALGGLIALAIGLSIDSLIRDLFSRNDWLGWFAAGLAAAAALAALVILVREVASLMRVVRIDKLRSALDRAALMDDGKAAASGVRELTLLYKDRPETAGGRGRALAHLGQVFDGRDLLTLAEADLLGPLDQAAKRLVADSAKRVSVVTAISPRAVVDIVFVLVSILGLIRQLAALYGGRPGILGFLRLARQVVSHLAITGGMAAGDSLLQQFLGHGIAARISARLGEGMINGLLTARVGIAAIEVCRPMPFLGLPQPGLSDVMGGVLSADKSKPAD